MSLNLENLVLAAGSLIEFEEEMAAYYFTAGLIFPERTALWKQMGQTKQTRADLLSSLSKDIENNPRKYKLDSPFRSGFANMISRIKTNRDRLHLNKLPISQHRQFVDDMESIKPGAGGLPLISGHTETYKKISLLLRELKKTQTSLLRAINASEKPVRV